MAGCSTRDMNENTIRSLIDGFIKLYVVVHIHHTSMVIIRPRYVCDPGISLNRVLYILFHSEPGFARAIWT